MLVSFPPLVPKIFTLYQIQVLPLAGYLGLTHDLAKRWEEILKEYQHALNYGLQYQYEKYFKKFLNKKSKMCLEPRGAGGIDSKLKQNLLWA